MSILTRLKQYFLKKIILHSGNYQLSFTEKDAKALGFKHLGPGADIVPPFYFRNPRHVSVGRNFHSLFNLRIEAWDQFGDQQFSPSITIGDNVIFNSDVHIGCIDKITIGNNVLLASRIYISDHSHGDITAEALKLAPAVRPLVSKGPVVIEDNVWIGEGVCILPGVTIGANAIIGANSVVTGNVPANAVVAGIPAKLLKTLVPEQA